MKNSLLSRGAIVALAALALGCSAESSTGPVSVKPQAGLIGGLLGTVTGLTSGLVNALVRQAPLSSDITVSAVIGSGGGRISIPAAGLTLTVPSGAVATNTTFKVTAIAGKMYAYEFEPHGTKFAKPLTFTQNVGLLSNLLSPPQGAYFTDRSALNFTNNTATAAELLPATYNLLSGSVSFPVYHFSGYMVSSGRAVAEE